MEGIYAANPMNAQPKPPKRLSPKMTFTAVRSTLDADATQCNNPSQKENLLLVNDNAPRMLLIAVHDVGHEALDLGGVVPALALDHGDAHVVVAVADLRDGADEELEIRQ